MWFLENTLQTVAAQKAASSAVFFLNLTPVFDLGALTSSGNQGNQSVQCHNLQMQMQNCYMTIMDMLQAQALTPKVKDLGAYAEVLSKVILAECEDAKYGR